MPQVYLLLCADNTYYTGWTTDLEKRMRAHNKGTGARYTRARLPVKVVYAEEVSSKSEALKRENQLRRLKRKDKEVLAANYVKHDKNTSAEKDRTQL